MHWVPVRVIILKIKLSSTLCLKVFLTRYRPLRIMVTTALQASSTWEQKMSPMVPTTNIQSVPHYPYAVWKLQV
ncbi:unnamed protein product [Allacma fusca]|uniref:Uncharacterized protein n=1 Tax=Allacma fusca TaxID=39272 RepID=A0A8J2KQ13_9HEXA|nr:unnamed protein product [Allacma fusca]